MVLEREEVKEETSWPSFFLHNLCDQKSKLSTKNKQIKILTFVPATFCDPKSLSVVFQLQSGSWRHYQL